MASRRLAHICRSTQCFCRHIRTNASVKPRDPVQIGFLEEFNNDLSFKRNIEKPYSRVSVVAAQSASSKSTHHTSLASGSRVGGNPAVRSSLSDVRSWPRVSIRSNDDIRAYELWTAKLPKKTTNQKRYCNPTQFAKAMRTDEPYIGPVVDFKKSFREMPGMAKRAFRQHKPPD